MITTANPTERFTGRVSKYVKYRPGYPDKVLKYLEKEGGLSRDSIVADVGSGTGIFTGLLLSKGYKVFAVEPNQSMQQAARQKYYTNKNFIPVDCVAEATTLETQGIDMVVCAQSFHWFNDDRTHVEFKRILKPGGNVALIWNNRNADADDFARAYEGLLKNDSIDYNKVNHRNVSDINFKAFFKNGDYKIVKYPNTQVFDEEGFLGRAFSSSYIPAEDTIEGERFKEILKDMFARHNKKGTISFHYNTKVYFGKV